MIVGAANYTSLSSTILVDAGGRPLYHLTSEKGKAIVVAAAARGRGPPSSSPRGRRPARGPASFAASSARSSARTDACKPPTPDSRCTATPPTARAPQAARASARCGTSSARRAGSSRELWPRSPRMAVARPVEARRATETPAAATAIDLGDEVRRQPSPHRQVSPLPHGSSAAAERRLARCRFPNRDELCALDRETLDRGCGSSSGS